MLNDVVHTCKILEKTNNTGPIKAIFEKVIASLALYFVFIKHLRGPKSKPKYHNCLQSLEGGGSELF